MKSQISAWIKLLKAEQKRIGDAISTLSKLDGGNTPVGRRVISAAGRRKIAAAQRARWAKVKASMK